MNENESHYHGRVGPFATKNKIDGAVDAQAPVFPQKHPLNFFFFEYAFLFVCLRGVDFDNWYQRGGNMNKNVQFVHAVYLTATSGY